MQALYNWPTIQDLSPELAVDAAEHSVRAHWVSLQAGFGADVTAAQTSENRKWAIVLAGVRAGAAASWRLGRSDLTARETKSSGMRVNAGRVSLAQPSERQLWVRARGMSALTQVEMEALAMCAYIGMAVPVLQGASLISTGHHYVPTTYGMFKGLKRQALGASSRGVQAWVEAMGERFDDLAFHKACHPVSPDLKRELAARPEVADKLGASGHGSAAIRLPAIPSEATGGKAAIALVRAASRVAADMGDTLTVSRGEALMESLERAGPGLERTAACNAVVAWVAEHSRMLAFCAGVVQQVHDTTGVGKNTLLAAYSVRKLLAAEPAEVSKGMSYARAAAARVRGAMEDGSYRLGTTEL
jgi:hypothetical protein